LFMLMATIYLSTMGRAGIREVAEQNLRKAHYAASRIAAIDGFSLRFSSPFFNEFVIETPRPARKLRDELVDDGFVAGMPLDRYFAGRENGLLLAVTEKSTRENIDRLADALAARGNE